MLNMRQLQKVIDSLKKKERQFNMRDYGQVFAGQQFVRYLDSAWTTHSNDTLSKATSLDELIPDSARQNVNRAAAGHINNLRANNEVAILEYNGLKKTFACIKLNGTGKFLYRWHALYYS